MVMVLVYLNGTVSVPGAATSTLNGASKCKLKFGTGGSGTKLLHLMQQPTLLLPVEF